MPYSKRYHVARNLAEAAAAGPWQLDLIAKRMRAAVRGGSRWATGLAQRMLTFFPQAAESDRLLAMILVDRGFERADAAGLEVRKVFLAKPQMRPVVDWSVPALCTTTDVAAWLGVALGELDWYADVQGRNPKQADPRLRHYALRWVPKRGGKFRLLEVPRPRLKALQRKVLHEIIDRVPPHEVAHAFRRGRSIRTFAAPHAGRAAVWRLDLKDFFPSIPASRVHALFRVAGYPLSVARLLTGLCTTRLPHGTQAPDLSSVPPVFWDRHLPQGAPTSPALANLAAYRLDVRLSAWASGCGVAYTRYADDLAFSGGADFAASAHRFRQRVLQILIEEGFRPNAAKSRWMTAGMRQHLAGVVVNRHLNIRRDEYDRLKAILTNCVRHGPVGQNRDGHDDFRAHLQGRIAQIVSIHPDRGRKLRALLDRIVWPDVGPAAPPGTQRKPDHADDWSI